MEQKPFHVIRSAGIEFSTKKEWWEYLDKVHSGETYRIITSFGKYDFNDCDICLNPEVMTFEIKKHCVFVTLEWCYCGNGLWSYGYNYSLGDSGGCSGCPYVDTHDDPISHRKGYNTKEECIIAACDRAIQLLVNAAEHNDGKAQRLIDMVVNYKKSIQKPQPVQLSLFGNSDF